MKKYDAEKYADKPYVVRKFKEGQALTENLIVVGLIAVAAIAVVSIFGKQIQQGFAALTRGMQGEAATVTGEDGDAEVQAATTGNYTP